MSWLTGDWGHLGIVAAKAALMYGVAVVGLRLGERRTLAQWTSIDFATAVAIGAVIGRTAIAANQSFVTGAAALATLLALHRVASVLRFNRLLGKLFDHRVRLLVVDGQIRRRQLRRCGLTDNDLYTHLRQQGVFTLEDVRFVLYETKGSITVVPGNVGEDAPLVARGLDDAAGRVTGAPNRTRVGPA